MDKNIFDPDSEVCFEFIGQELKTYKGIYDKIQFDINDDGAILIIALHRPTNDELKEFFSENLIIKAVLLSNAVWLTFKFGNLDWMDAPFSLHLSKLSNKSSIYNYIKRIRIVIIDTETGRIMFLSEVLLTDVFVQKISYLIANSYTIPFDKKEYDLLLDSIKYKFTPKQIAEHSAIEFVC